MASASWGDTVFWVAIMSCSPCKSSRGTSKTAAKDLSVSRLAVAPASTRWMVRRLVPLTWANCCWDQPFLSRSLWMIMLVALGFGGEIVGTERSHVYDIKPPSGRHVHAMAAQVFDAKGGV